MNIKQAIAEGRVVLTDLRVGTLHGASPSSPLKMTRMIELLEKNLATLESLARQSLAQKIRDALIEDASDVERQNAYNSVIDLSYQLRLCHKCACSDCISMTDDCRCDGCLFASRVSECSKIPREGLEVRVFEPGRATIEGEPVLKTEYDRKTGETYATVRKHNGLERRFRYRLTDNMPR